MYKLAAVFVGMLSTIMVTLNAKLCEYVGNIPSLIVIHVTGIMALTAVLIIHGKKINLNSGLPYYYYCGGVFGVAMVLLNSTCIMHIGASLTLAMGVLGQIVISSIVDNFGLFGMNKHKFNKMKIIGFIVILVGLGIMTKYS